jgi:MinD superfamily P-loop ATPase
MDIHTGAKIQDFCGLPRAEINQELCNLCGICEKECRFEAIKKINNSYIIDNFNCEGCGVCEAICPAEAITLKPAITGELQLYTDERVFSTAQLKMGSGNSGKLVSEVKKNLISHKINSELAIIDGSPGIGCPVIASLSGADLVLIVAEPSVSGISDMERIIKTAEKFQTRIAVCINKYDTNPDKTEMIETYCQQQNLPCTGRIPFDPEAVQAINEGKSLVEIECPAGQAVKEVYRKTMGLLF